MISPFDHTIIVDTLNDWTSMNLVLRGAPFLFHESKPISLIFDTCVIQHMLRNNEISKVSDSVNITPLVFIVASFVLSNTFFKVVKLLFYYIKSLLLFGKLTSIKSLTKPWDIILPSF